MQAYKTEFIELALHAKALTFGEFTLKSGRISPYFFNAGRFNTGRQLATLGRLYAQALQDATIEYDMVFGPAYKGIPLVSSLVIALADHYQREVPYCFNRKLAKTYGEGGTFIGHPLQGRVLIIDDVMTAGTAVREALAWVETAKAIPAGIILMLDRQERGHSLSSAVQEIHQNYQIPVISLITLSDLMCYFRQTKLDDKILTAITVYQTQYGIKDLS